MFERILVPLDGSQRAEAILTQVRRILLRKDAEILLVQAIGLPPSVEGDFGGILATLQSDASGYLQTLERNLSDQGARVRSVVRQGPAAETILDVAKAEKASLIAMSTMGRRGIARFILGSVAEKVVRASPIPVLAVHSYRGTGGAAAPAQASEIPLRRILVAMDAADLSLEAVPPAIHLAQLFGASVLMVNVCEGGPICSVPVSQMTQAYEQFQMAGVPAEPVMMQGDPASGILEACTKHAADLIALTTHGRSGVSRWMLGSVAEKILRTATVPLLVVRSLELPRPGPAAGTRKESVKV